MTMAMTMSMFFKGVLERRSQLEEEKKRNKKMKLIATDNASSVIQNTPLWNTWIFLTELSLKYNNRDCQTAESPL